MEIRAKVQKCRSMYLDVDILLSEGPMIQHLLLNSAWGGGDRIRKIEYQRHDRFMCEIRLDERGTL